MNDIIIKTVLSGVIVFVFSQYVLLFILQPIQKFKSTQGKIDNKLKFYSNVIVSGDVLEESIKLETSKEIRNLSCELESNYKQILLRTILSVVKLIPSKKKIAESAKILIFLSNNCARQGQSGTNSDKIKEIRASLSISEFNS